MFAPASSPSPNVPGWVLALLLALFLLQCGHGLAVKSGTADELGAHLPAGILHWKSGHAAGGLANPPLGQLLVAAGPVLTGTADRPLRDEPRHLLPGRLPVVLLGAATVLVIGAIGRRLGGPLAGVAALGAAALSPNLVAHARLATLDLPVTAFTAFATYVAWRWRDASSGPLLIGVAVATGTAACIKFTGLHLLPALTLGALLLPGAPSARALRAGRLLAAGAVGVAAIAWLSYGAEPPRLLLPTGWVEGVLGKWEHGRTGHFAYLLGERSAEGFPHYFLVALAVKTPLPLLLAGIVGVAALVRGAARDGAGFAALILLPAIWILGAMSLVHRVDIGLRHVLPTLPAGLALAGLGWATLWRGGRVARGLAIGLAVSLVATAGLTTPHHLSYFHALAGGPARGDRILIDSNLDWGQDEGAFRRWARRHDVHVNPPRPVAGRVAANVNSIRGILRPDDLRLRWMSRLPVERSFGHTWRVATADEAVLSTAAARDPVAALDYAWWLVGVGRAVEALSVLDRHELADHPVHGRTWWLTRGEALLASGDLAEAGVAARRASDADLAVEIAYRLNTPLARERVPAVVAALARRGHPADAAALSRARLGQDLLAVTEFPRGAAGWKEIAREKDLGREQRALTLAGERLAVHPDDAEALALYGELVVRRKLGLSEFEWPDVDWSDVRRDQ